MGGLIISGVIFCVTACIMIGTGISQFHSKEPVGFYTGEKPPLKEQLSDVNAWNKKHGIMWMIYGFCIAGSWICSAFIGDRLYTVIPLMGGTLVPIVFMIIYHHNLVKKYYIKK